MQFPRVLGLAMVAVMFTYVVLGQLCLLSFGNIDNGSITAFLQQKYGGPFFVRVRCVRSVWRMAAFMRMRRLALSCRLVVCSR